LSALLVKIDGAVGCLTLNRPEKRNAIDTGLRAELTKAFSDLDTNDDVRVVILTGAGAGFCAGVDLTAAQSDQGSSNPPASQPRLSDPLDRFSKPVLAAINGVAVGGGLELALACDMRIAATTARFALTEVKIGSLAGSGGTQRLPTRISPALAAQMLFTGEMISAERALQGGLVSEVVADGALIDRAWELARTVANNAPLSLRAVKQALRAAIDDTLKQGFDVERKLFVSLAQTEDRAEGRAAFRERRKPNFRGR
jgi:E-phenylitaconyl-CoA hydratase